MLILDNKTLPNRKFGNLTQTDEISSVKYDLLMFQKYDIKILSRVTFVLDVGFLSHLFDDNPPKHICNPTPSPLKTIHKNIIYEFWILTKIISCFFDLDSLFHVFK